MTGDSFLPYRYELNFYILTLLILLYSGNLSSGALNGHFVDNLDENAVESLDKLND